MKKPVRWAAIAAALCLCGPVTASPAASPAPEQHDFLDNLKFRNLGPANGGGRVAAVAGIPGDPNIYYVGAAGGGVWKTTDGGNSWKAIFEKEATASIGALAVAPSNPNVIWVGTGEGNPRNDALPGKGVYVSTDAGHSWKSMGLTDTAQITKIAIDPFNPDVVLVAALGHEWAPNAERGIFRTTDGGATWKKVLYVNDSTGAADLAMQTGNPKVLFAAMWQFRRYPWELVSGGEGSGLYRSNDGGVTWKKLSKGLPEGTLGRIAVASAPSNPSHIYALVEAKKGMLWESRDQGDEWKEITDTHAVNVRPFYFSQLQVSPENENKVYFLSFDLLVSEDGGKTTQMADRGVHVDHHALWIDPLNPSRMIQGNDGGAYLTQDSARTWRYLSNLPIEQFYMVAVDSSIPYRLCGGLQDNNAWCGPSNSLNPRGISGRDWFTTAGGDGEYAVPAPSDASIIYSDSQNGNISRLDLKTRLERSIKPYLADLRDMNPADLKYRFNWTSPIAVSARSADEVYLGGNALFRSTDGGGHWSVISPDLTRNDKSKQVLSGGPINMDLSGAETYGTIISVSLAETDDRVIWVGTDDGLVQVTRDGGKTWANVTKSIPRAPEWARVYQVGVSPFDAGTAYVAFDAHMLDDNRPYVYRTEDYGRSWVDISKGFPSDASVRVVREDPNRKGFLVAGTETGLFFSADRGGSWKPLKADFPTVSVWDLKFVKATHDLVVATHGRGLFVFDNLTSVEEWEPAFDSGDFHLFSTLPATRFHRWGPGGFERANFSAPNPPYGLVIDYYLKSEIKAEEGEKKGKKTPVKIVITDAKGNPVATEYGDSKQGVNRFVWKMRYDSARPVSFVKERPANDFFDPSIGPAALAGDYRISVTVKGKTESRPARINADPNLGTDPAVYRDETVAALEARGRLNALRDALNRNESLLTQIRGIEKLLKGDEDRREPTAAERDVLKASAALSKKLQEFKDSIFNSKVQADVGVDFIHYQNLLHDDLTGTAFGLASSYADPPNEVVREEIAEEKRRLGEALSKFNSIVSADVAAFNKTAAEKGAPTLFAGEPVKVEEAKLP
jgi:photosystem II stability/assembly factor-like uncharacterized protein